MIPEEVKAWSRQIVDDYYRDNPEAANTRCSGNDTMTNQVETMGDVDMMLERLRDSASPRLREVAEAVRALNSRDATELFALWLGEGFAEWCDRR